MRVINSTGFNTTRSPTTGDWKSMPTVGQGVQEIRLRDSTGAFRVIYVARFAQAVYVLHCFQKKTQTTSKGDIELANKRYRELRKELGI
jgi:phage-related protein